MAEPAEAADAAVHVSGLRKSYGAVQAVDGMDLTIPRGQVFAVLGPNGAGKTTTIEILEGYRRRDAGTVQVLGLDPGTDARQLKKRIGIVLQSSGVERYLTVSETIDMYSAYYPHPRPTGEIVELVGLAEKRDTRVTQLSGGQQRRLDVAIALAGDPELLFLDEPTTGFDPSARHEAWQIVKNLAALGKTVLLTTHYMDEAQHLANRVAVVARGRVVAEGSPATLAGRADELATVTFSLSDGAVPPPELGATTDPDGRTSFRSSDLTRDLHRLTGWAIETANTIDGLQVERPSLEDVYLRLTADGGEQE